ncbi:MAG: hypothetical protein RMK79_03515 [Anaerolineae bacterium]|nr:hypothetical protein [Anaerolineae bacterium]
MKKSLISKEYFWLLVAFVLVLTIANVVTPLLRPVAEHEAIPLTEVAPGQATGTLQLVAQGFGQEEMSEAASGTRVGYAFLVRNSDTEHALRSSAYRVIAQDTAKNVLASDDGPIVLVLPGQTLGIGGTLFVPDSKRVANLIVQLGAGEFTKVRSSPFLSVEHVRYSASPNAAVSGVIRNPFKRNITGLRISAIAYDADDRIVGGGFSHLAFIPAESTLGVIISLNRAPEIARVELYPGFSSQSAVTWPDEGLPPGGHPLVLGAQGFGQRGAELGYAFLLENPNDTLVAREIHYHLTAYSATGEVLATDDGRLDVLLPSEKLGVGGHLLLDHQELISRVEVVILPGRYQLSAAIPPFRVVDVAYRDDRLQPYAIGRLLNPYPQNATHLHLSAVAYNASGEIIGGGYAPLESVPAHGEVIAEVPIVSSEVPVRVELYATRTALTRIE